MQTSTIYNHTKQSQDNDKNENSWLFGVGYNFDDGFQDVMTPQQPVKDKDDDRNNDDNLEEVTTLEHPQKDQDNDKKNDDFEHVLTPQQPIKDQNDDRNNDDNLEEVTTLEHPPKDQDNDKKNDDDMVYFLYVHLRQINDTNNE